MRIGELAERTGLSAYTIRYYERIGLLPFAYRDAGGRRVYDDTILVWIEFLGRLKTTGMPIREMLQYGKLRAEGDHTGPQRRRILETHREKVRAHLADLEAWLPVLDTKIDTYVDAEKRTRSDDNKSGPNA